MSWSPNFGRPAAGVLKVGSGYWAVRGSTHHGAIDIPMPVGTPIYAMQSGKIVRADQTDRGDAGIWAAIQHGDGSVTRYMHFSKNLVREGDFVRKGQQIGVSGNTGSSSGPHLHIDIKVPEALLPSIQAAAGKPTVGWIPPKLGFAYGVPAEPWVPVDSYRDTTIAEARKLGIPLYAEMNHGSLLTLVLGGFVLWGGWKLWKAYRA